MEKTKKTYTKPELERVKFNFKAQMQSQSIADNKNTGCYKMSYDCYGYIMDYGCYDYKYIGC